MAISYVAGANAVSAGNSVSVTKPTGTTSGDVLIAAMQTGVTNATFTPPTGWTQIIKSNETGSGMTCATYYRVAGASEPASYAWSTSGGYLNVTIGAFRGVDNTTPVDASASQDNTNTAVSSVTVPSVTPGAGNSSDWWVAACADNFSASYSTPPTGWTLASGTDDANGDAIFYKALSSTAATGTATFSLGGAAGSVGFSILLLPAGGGSTVTGSANEIANAALGESVRLLAPATEQANAVVAQSGTQLLANGQQVPGNAAIAVAAVIIAGAQAVQGNAAIAEAALIAALPVSALAGNAAIGQAAQLLAPATEQSNAVLAASGGIAGSTVTGAATLVANASVSEVPGQVAAPAALIASAALVVSGVAVVAAQVANEQGNAVVAQSLVVVLAAQVAGIQANAAMSESARLLSPSSLIANAVLAAAGGIAAQIIIGRAVVTDAAARGTATLSDAAIGSIVPAVASVGVAVLADV